MKKLNDTAGLPAAAERRGVRSSSLEPRIYGEWGIRPPSPDWDRPWTARHRQRGLGTLEDDGRLQDQLAGHRKMSASLIGVSTWSDALTGGWEVLACIWCRKLPPADDGSRRGPLPTSLKSPWGVTDIRLAGCEEGSAAVGFDDTVTCVSMDAAT
ncbi:hypothetical protein CSOJ01_03191 [Colletotrichum sojae]|uniref:Uncharacterized protein n=1 Tax=Colletotrichum sojae TaxID=2175907 RepID=A0A8H6JP47_9PEZI|nr:hypothetical protein CSOJ01_03191 [Colletotrichum sojae]